jgi:large subunit ribosomal protein L10
VNRDQKAAVIERVATDIQEADAIFAVDYRGISVSEAAELRAKLRDAGTRFRIVKNSLTERATDQAGADGLRELLEGPTALAFVAGDAALAAKALNDAARNLGTLEFKGGLMNGSSLSADEIRSIARLPAREVLHGQLVGTIAAPLTGLVRTLNALIAGVAIQLRQIADQGLVSGEAPSAAEEPAAAEEGKAEPAPETEAEPASPAASDEEATPEAQTGAEASSEDGSASEALGGEAAADDSAPEEHSASEADTSADTNLETTEPDASAQEPQAEEAKEE